MAFGREVTEQYPDLRLAQLERVPLGVEEDEAPNPVNVRLLGPRAVVLPPDREPHLVEELGSRHASRLPRPINRVSCDRRAACLSGAGTL